MKTFCFTIDDNIRCLKEIMEKNLDHIFQQPYLALLRRLHERFDLKIQLNLFYKMEGFDLSQMSDRYASQWAEVSDWLKLSFHSEWENVCPYENSGYDEVFEDCRAVNREILRFAGPDSLAQTTTVHYCRTTDEGLRAMADNGVKGLLGLFGTEDNPRTSYGLGEELAGTIRKGNMVKHGGITFAGIDMVINTVLLQDLLPSMERFICHDSLWVMIHEQYFYEDYAWHQPDFEQKLVTVFSALRDSGHKSCLFEELLR